MKRMQYGLLAVFSALALTACGDDVTKVYEDGEFTSVTSLKDSECTEENEGAIIYSTEDKGMYACADGEWTAIAGKDSPLFRCETKTLKDSSGIAIYCDGDSIGVVKNGKAGATGKVGAAGKDGTNGKDGVGIDGASCTVADTVDAKTKAVLGYKLICADSLMGIVWNGAAGESGSSCTVADSVNAKTKAVVGFKLMCADTLAGFVKNGVDGLPGEAGTSCVIDSATADSVWIACGEEVAAIALPGAGAKTYTRKVTMSLPLPEDMVEDMVEIAPQTKITVMGLDKDWELNGQVFVSDMNYDVTKFGVPVLASPKMGENFANFAVTGTVEATVSNPYVLIQVECQLFIPDYDGITLKMVYHAYADLSDSESPLVVSYLTDVKAPRVKKLVTGGMSFDKAMEQADKELYKAYGMDYKGRVESLFEGTALDYDLAWMFYMELITTFDEPPFIINVGELTARMKALFAENGDFNTPISYDGIVAKTVGMVSESMLPVDMVVGVGPVSGSGSNFMNFVSRMLEQEYDLGSCEGVKKDTIAFSKVGGGLYSDTAFVCLAGVNLWTFASFEDVNRLLGDEEETFGKCSSDNEWEVNTKLYLKRCEKDANGKYDWKPADYLEKYDLGYCQSDDEGKFVALPYDEYYICHDYQWEYIDSSQVRDGVLCNSKTKQDSIYALAGQVFACGDSLNGDNDTVYYWFNLYDAPSNIYGELAFGECTKELYGVVKSYSVNGHVDYLVCNAEQKWEFSPSLGMCDASKVGVHREIFNADGMTSYEYLKCTNSGTAKEPYYSWHSADDIDIEVGFPCTSVKEGFDEETATYTYYGSRYYCNAETGEWYGEYGFRYGYDGGCTDYLNPATGKAFAIGESVKFGTETLVCDSDSSWYSLSADEIAMGFPCTKVDASEYVPDTDGNHYAAREYQGDYYYCNAKTGFWLDRFDEAPCTAIYSPYSKEAFSPNGGTIGYDGSIYECKSDGSWEWLDYIN